MAKIIENEKEFKVIEITAREMLKIGCGNICDHCGETSENGYYIAVLNRWFCPTCYEEWHKHATKIRRDGLWIELKNFNYFQMLLGL